MSRYVLALDQGTTSSRAILFDHDGAVAGVDQYEFTQHFPQPGWVEHDPEEIWTSQLRAARGALAAAGAAARDVAAIGISNQRETALVWDRATGEPLYNAIVWQSRQTAPICDALRERGLEDEVRARTGLVIDSYFSGTKFRFILDAIDGAQARAERGELACGTVDSWLLYRLTGGRRPRHGVLERLAHACSTTSTSWTLGRSRCWKRSVLPKRNASGSVANFQRDLRHGRRGVVRRRDSHRRDRRRPAVRVVRPALHRAGPGQEHLRYRLLPLAHEHRPARLDRLRKRACSPPSAWGIDGKSRVRPRGQRLHRRCSAVQWLRDGHTCDRDRRRDRGVGGALGSKIPEGSTSFPPSSDWAPLTGMSERAAPLVGADAWERRRGAPDTRHARIHRLSDA